MSGTFSSLSSALSALRYNRVAMDVASGNVANAGTAGYARRMAVAQSVGAPAVPAMWSRWEGAAGGVETGGIVRMVDPFLDARSRSEHGMQSYLDARAAALVRVESTLGEPGDNGLAASLAEFKQGWHDVANNPDDGAARSQVLEAGKTLVVSIASQARSVSSEWADQRDRLTALTTEVTSLSGDLAKINDSLRVAAVAGTDAGALLDRRDQLTLRLSELTGATTTTNDDGTVDLSVGGVALVEGNTVHPMTVAGAGDLDGAGASPVTVSIGGAPVTVTRGEIGAATSLLDTTLPSYLSRLDTVVKAIADAVNGQHTAGKDLNGDAGTAFFTGDTAASIAVALTDPDKIAAAAMTGGPLDSSNADKLAGLPLGGDDYRRLVTGFGSEVASARRVAGNQSILTTQVDASREALSGISIDEEMVALLAAQRGYEGAARVLTALDSVLDTLINRTGLLR